MAISGDFTISAAVSPHKFDSLRVSTHFPPTKVDCSMFSNASSNVSRSALDAHSLCCHSQRQLGNFGDYKFSQNPMNQDLDSSLLNAINLNFFERLHLAWKIVFPPSTAKKNSNAKTAKQRLKMILFSDRCDVSEVAKQKIVSSIVSALSDFVEIESQDKVQLSVSTDSDHGTIYSVTVPVRRVRSEYQMDEESAMVTNIEYKDTGETSGSVDVKFEFYIPSDKLQDFGM